MSFYTIIIVGNLGKEPEMRYTSSGQAVANFSVAANRQYTDANGQSVKEVIWFRISAWGKTAENCNQFLHTGSKLLVEGRLHCDPETGGPRVFLRQDGTADRGLRGHCDDRTVPFGTRAGWFRTIYPG